MSTVIDTLMHEHRVIEEVLKALEAAASSVDAGQDIERTRVAEFAAFFSGFADRCHHGKEEDLLFAAMVEAGFSREQGPIAVMLTEHAANREHVGALAAIGRGTGPLGQAERQSFVAHALEFVPLLQQHIAKEDQILYPMALRTLHPEQFDRMAGELDAFEEGITGKGEHQRLHALADELVAAYPGNATTPTPACHHCHGRA